MFTRYIPLKTGFKQNPSERYVRDGIIYLTDKYGSIEKAYNKSVIEEIRLFDLKKIDLKRPFKFSRCPDTALLIRNVFDHESRSTEPNGFNEVTRNTDVSELKVPFDPKNEQFILYSEGEKGEKIITVNLGLPFKGFTKPIRIDGERIDMYHLKAGLNRLIWAHMSISETYGELKRNPELPKKALDEFNAIIENLPWYEDV
jgi:hypothetical protein